MIHSCSPDVEIKYVGGKDPEMLFKNGSGEVVKVLCCVTVFCINHPLSAELGILLLHHGWFTHAWSHT